MRVSITTLVLSNGPDLRPSELLICKGSVSTHFRKAVFFWWSKIDSPATMAPLLAIPVTIYDTTACFYSRILIKETMIYLITRYLPFQLRDMSGPIEALCHNGWGQAVGVLGIEEDARNYCDLCWCKITVNRYRGVYGPTPTDTKAWGTAVSVILSL